MRQDPDVLLIGEIRDRETAEIAIQASLTGHLVLSTLHTNDAGSAVTRLVDIGVAPYKIATAVKGVLAQRLLRRLCSCGGRREGEPGSRRPSAFPDRRQVAEPAPVCADCHGDGYRGRLAIAEVLIASPDFERAVAAGESAERLTDAARRTGMRSLWDCGMANVTAGLTSRSELLRVAAPPATVDARARSQYLPATPDMPPTMSSNEPVVPVRVATVDVYVIRPMRAGWRVLVLQRGLKTRCPESWETVHGTIEAGERPEQAAVREVQEESGLTVTRLYNITVQPFYLHRLGVVTAAVVFAAFVDEPADVRLGDEHQAFEWLSPDQAVERYIWPRSRTVLPEIVALLESGDAGPVDDVLRVF